MMKKKILSVISAAMAVLALAAAAPSADEAEVQEHRYAVLRVQFQDQSFTKDSLQISMLLSNAETYLNRQFLGKDIFKFELGPVVTAKEVTSYYGKNGTDRYDLLAPSLVKEACTLSDDAVDFSDKDNSGDGYVDNVCIIFAGPGEEGGSGEDLIWPKHSTLNPGQQMLHLDGKTVNSYTLCSEENGCLTFLHELFHSFGLPDLYDTDAEGSGGECSAVGSDVSIMAMESDQGVSTAVPDLNAIEREMLGNGVCDTLRLGTNTLRTIDAYGEYLRYDTPVEGDFYLVENRTGKGLVIFHIDRSENPAGWSDWYKKDLSAKERWEVNQVNCNPSHPCAAAVAGFNTDIAITDVRTNADGTVTFEVTRPLEITGTDTYQDAVVLRWTNLDKSTCSVYLDGEPFLEDIVPYSADSFACTIDGLEPEKEYTVEIRTRRGNSLETTITTEPFFSQGYPFIVLRDTERNEDGSFVKGCRIPLRVWNCPDASKIEWYFNSRKISPEADQTFPLSSSGTLTARITHEDGSVEMIIKKINIK